MNTPIESGPESAQTAAWAQSAEQAAGRGAAASLVEFVEAHMRFADASTEPLLRATHKGLMQVTAVRD